MKDGSMSACNIICDYHQHAGFFMNIKFLVTVNQHLRLMTVTHDFAFDKYAVRTASMNLDGMINFIHPDMYFPSSDKTTFSILLHGSVH